MKKNEFHPKIVFLGKIVVIYLLKSDLHPSKCKCWISSTLISATASYLQNGTKFFLAELSNVRKSYRNTFHRKQLIHPMFLYCINKCYYCSSTKVPLNKRSIPRWYNALHLVNQSNHLG